MSKLNKKQKRVFPRWLIVSGMVGAVVALITMIGGTAYALHLEENDGFCASCHTEPETTFFQQSQTKPAVTLASFHAQTERFTARCIDCHSGGGTFGRATGLLQGQADLIAYWSGHYRNPAVTTSSLKDDSCLKCHEDIGARRGFDNHFHQFLARWQQLDPNAKGCVDCHTAHTTTADVQAFLNRDTVTAVCNDCHRTLGR